MCGILRDFERVAVRLGRGGTKRVAVLMALRAVGLMARGARLIPRASPGVQNPPQCRRRLEEGDGQTAERQVKHGEKMAEVHGIQTLTLGGQRFVVLPEADFLRLTGEPPEPELPPPNERGNYPALETMRALLARDIIRSRRALGWSQAELARRAGVRPETLNRIEQGKHSASVPTIDKLDRALKAGEAKQQSKAACGKDKANKRK